MMKYLKITLLILLILTFSTNVRATETGREQGRGKVSIIGHTGQDPVYKSFAGKHEFKDQKQNSKFVRSIVQNDFSEILIEILLHNSEFPAIFSPTDTVGYPIPLINPGIELGLQLNHYSSIPFTSSSNLPAPPAFLLVLAGIAIRKRRMG
jgi:hypothetical protein